MSQSLGRVVLASGGTGGHVYPALAVAEELRARGESPLFILPEPEYRETVAGAGFECVELPAGPWLRQGKGRRIVSIAAVSSSVVRATFALPRWNAGVVIGFGSYGSIAPVMAAWLRRIPTAILEPNAVAGLANRTLGRFCQRIYTGRITEFRNVDERKVRRVGMPVRKEIETMERHRDSAVVRILILGDAQRSGFLDERLPPVLARIASERATRIVHLTAPDNIDAVLARYEGCGASVEPPTSRIHERYSTADLVVARSGASTLAELSATSTPSLLVPLGWSAEDHQGKNAEVFRRAGAALVRSENEWNAEDVADALRNLIADDDSLESMGRHASDLGFRGSATTLVDDLLALREEKRSVPG